MTEDVKFLPLGSVVTLKGSDHPLIIVARAVLVTEETRRYFDYGGCLYPEGMIGDSMAYFNGSGIDTVLAEGFADERNERYEADIAQALSESDLLPDEDDEVW